MKYYIADTHFGHENCIKFDNRPFANADEMDRMMIEQWNAVVKPNDDVYILGDFCYRSTKEPLYYLKKLNGRKHLIIGNHDKHLLKDEEAMAEFVSVDKMTYVKDGKHTIVLCHFPLAEWNHYYRGAWHIFGHIHAGKKGCYHFLKNEEKALNAGCMINNYMPVTIEQLIENNEVYKKEENPLEAEDIRQMFSESHQIELSYHFYVNGKREVVHTFEEVMKAAYEYLGTFEIREEDREEYSRQEWEYLKVIMEG